MISLIRSKARLVVSSMAARGSSSTHLNPFPLSRFSALPNPFFGFPRIWVASNQTRLDEVKDTQTGVEEEFTSFKEQQNVPKSGAGMSLFDELKQRFLSFKKHKYLKEWEHFRTLAEAQSPKFMVIGCVDSRVCPSNILGFQPGEAFMVRNVANLVPPLESGPSETNAALEFAVNTLEVENILIIGHSSCAGIQALMNLQDDEESSFVKSWVSKGKVAKLRTQAEANHLNFDDQCRYCEKESINRSLLNLLTYPWLKDRVRKDLLFVHGGYYDFLNCTFEKWTLDLEGNNIEEKGSYSVKDHEIWC